MTASACSSAAKSGTSVGPQAASDGCVRGILAGRKEADDVPARAEKRGQLREDPAGSAGKHDTQSPPAPDGEVPAKI